jgi:hypothetical protein
VRIAVLLCLLAACSGANASNDPPLVEADTAAANLSGWRDVSFGVARKEDAGAGATALLVYGGYGAKPAHAQSWAQALAGARGEALDLGALYAIRGPRDAAYSAREIGNRALAAELTARAPARIVVVAHSSGAYVANELLGDLSDEELARTSYYDLDGGTTGLTHAIAAKLASLAFVYARDPDVGLSRNGAFMIASAQEYDGSRAVKVDASGSGCATKNCLHDVLITSRPHDPRTFNVALDYTDFDGRQVTVSYFSP